METSKTGASMHKEALGAILLNGNACSFLVWAPHARCVEVSVIHPQNRMLPMQSIGGGYFHAVVEDISEGALYRYRLDGQKERSDPASRSQPLGVHGPSQIVGTGFDWIDSEWSGLPLEKYVFYELHVGTFTPQGTLESIIPRLSALKDLGVTAIELMPVAQFPGDRNWGYDGVYPYAVQASYGGPLALKALVNACHQEGLAVLLDVVYNHLGPEGNYLADFGPYFTDYYKTPWGQAVNFDRAGSSEVRRYFIENALAWITDFHIDALRLDAIHAIVDSSAEAFLEELGAAVHTKAAEIGRDAYLIPESNRNDPRVMTPVAENGLGLDAVWNDDFHHSLHVLLTGERDGYYEDYSGIKDLVVSYREGFFYAQRYSRFRQKRYGKSSTHVPAKRFVVFAQNHDQVGNRRLGDRLSQSLSLDQLKLAAGIVLLSPYLPLLFMGEEYGETSPFQYFVSHNDPSLVAAVRQGRRDELARFGSTTDIPDPAEESTFRRSQLNWDLRNAGRHRVLWRFYRELLRLRREIPALARLDKNALEVVSFADSKVLVVNRGDRHSPALIVGHFGHTPTEISLPVPPGRWRRVLDSAVEQSCDEGNPPAVILESQGQVQFSLNPWRFLVLVQCTGRD